jgi:cell division protease FtsH
MNSRWWQSILFYLLLLVGVMFFVSQVIPLNRGPEEVPLYTLIDNLKQGSIDTIRQEDNTLIGLKGDDAKVKTSFLGGTADIITLLEANGLKTGVDGVKIDVKSGGIDWGSTLLNILPLALFGVLIFFLFRSARGANSQAMNFGKSKARLASPNRPTVTFADVAGVEESKQELMEVVEFLKSPAKFTAVGARIPHGVLLVGPPGCGKTLLARAVAGEAGVPFFSISGSEFVEMFVGVGAARVRDLFDQAKRSAPCIIFVDEIDAVGRQRGAGLGGGHDEREQTLNQILVEMDGFDTNTSVIVLAATNRPDILDPALLRPGRFDRNVVIDLPDVNGRKAILGVHAKGKPISADVKLEVLAKQTTGFSGADLANMLNEGALLAARRNQSEIKTKDLEEAIERVIAGPERRSRVVSDKEKRMTAYHEAGHALVAQKTPNADPVHKISIVARGMMGGFTRFLPTEDRRLWTRSQFEAQIAVSLGGRAAEEEVFGDISIGARSDIEQATKLARKMVTEYGMSAKLGPRMFGRREEMVFLGREISEQRDYSERTALVIDSEVHELIEQAHAKARAIIAQYRAKLDEVALKLLEKETLDDSAFAALFPESVTPPAPAPGGGAVSGPSPSPAPAG